MPTDLHCRAGVIPGIYEFTQGGPPAPAATNDGNQWVDGFCWLFCGQQRTRVLWIGPVSVAGAQASMYACGSCIQELHDRVWHSILLNDAPWRATVVAGPASPEATDSQHAGDREQTV
ncbi:hypothetical protein [Kitasatospora sp. NPDC091276]|uniref:hypothetical protein n=1 Tax=Kitasatospora sp. NPDC091276 TaxID=3155300 RepID=UPI00344234E0